MCMPQQKISLTYVHTLSIHNISSFRYVCRDPILCRQTFSSKENIKMTHAAQNVGYTQSAQVTQYVLWTGYTSLIMIMMMVGFLLQYEIQIVNFYSEIKLPD